VTLLILVGLVDTNSVDPQRNSFLSVSGMPQRGEQIMGDWKREALEYDRFSVFYGAPCIGESEVLSLLACVDVLGLKATTNRILLSTWSDVKNAKVTRPKWLVVVLRRHLGEAMATVVAVDLNRETSRSPSS
jgi:hypothetical protein